MQHINRCCSKFLLSWQYWRHSGNCCSFNDRDGDWQVEISGYILAVIVGISIVTFIPRVVPLMLLSKMEIPKWGIDWLKHVPVAVMASLLAQVLLLSEQVFSIKDNVLNLAAALPAFLVAIFTRSLLGTVMIGVLSLMILRVFF